VNFLRVKTSLPNEFRNRRRKKVARWRNATRARDVLTRRSIMHPTDPVRKVTRFSTRRSVRTVIHRRSARSRLPRVSRVKSTWMREINYGVICDNVRLRTICCSSCMRFATACASPPFLSFERYCRIRNPEREKLVRCFRLRDAVVPLLGSWDELKNNISRQSRILRK